MSDATSLPNVPCRRDHPHDGHRHVNEGPRGGCGLPEWCPGRPAAAVPEAEDGRAVRQIEALKCGAPSVDRALDDMIEAIRTSAPARDDERERLAAAWDYGWRAGWDDSEHGDGQVTPNAYDPSRLAAALPEGQEGT